MKCKVKVASDDFKKSRTIVDIPKFSKKSCEEIKSSKEQYYTVFVLEIKVSKCSLEIR